MDRRQPEPDRRKVGRPRVDEPRASVSTWLPAKDHDRLIELANKCGQSVSATIRQVLILTIR